MCAVSMLVGAPRNCSRFVCRYDFHERRLTFSLRTHTSVLLYSEQYVTLAIILSHSGERMHRNKIPPQRMHAACRIITWGCSVVSSALRSSTATVKAIVVWNSWSRRYPPQMRENLLPVRISSENLLPVLHTRRQLYKPSGLLYCGGCTWTRISRQPVVYVNYLAFFSTNSSRTVHCVRSARFLFR